jgi:PAS domain-containing protein
MDATDYKVLFDQSSSLTVVMDTGFTIVAASDAFLKATKTVRENIVGQGLFDVFPDNPADETANGKSKVLDSFNWVLKNKRPDKLPVVKYDIPKPESQGGGFEVKYWQAIHSPVLDEENNVKYIIQRAEDVTENKTLNTQLEFEKKALKLVEASEKRYNMMLMKSPFGFAVFKGKNMVITLANDSIKTFWGKGNDLEGKPLFDVLPELKDSAFKGLLDQVYATGTPFYGDEVLASVLRNGKLEDAYYSFVYQPYLEADETISGVTVIAYDVTKMVLAHKKIEESEIHFRQLADLMPAKISNANAAGDVTYFNKHWLEYSGYTFEELIPFRHQNSS